MGRSVYFIRSFFPNSSYFSYFVRYGSTTRPLNAYLQEQACEATWRRSALSRRCWSKAWRLPTAERGARQGENGLVRRGFVSWKRNIEQGYFQPSARGFRLERLGRGHSVQCLQIELIVGLDGHEVHVLPE